jgi:hypothetical protein
MHGIIGLPNDAFLAKGWGWTNVFRILSVHQLINAAHVHRILVS